MLWKKKGGDKSPPLFHTNSIHADSIIYRTQLMAHRWFGGINLFVQNLNLSPMLSKTKVIFHIYQSPRSALVKVLFFQSSCYDQMMITFITGLFTSFPRIAMTNFSLAFKGSKANNLITKRRVQSLLHHQWTILLLRIQPLYSDTEVFQGTHGDHKLFTDILCE